MGKTRKKTRESYFLSYYYIFRLRRRARPKHVQKIVNTYIRIGKQVKKCRKFAAQKFYKIAKKF